jgi:dihydroorotate dehydrogenase
MGVYTRLVRPILFRADAENMHTAAIRAAEALSASEMACRAVSAFCSLTRPRLECSVAGLKFRNPLGLAAGYDKNGRCVPLLAALGFGHIEIGSVSADPSEGNPKPRLWRLPGDRGLIVNYGLPNDGADVVAERLARSRAPVPAGVNIVNTNRGAQAWPSDEDAIIADYIRSIRRLDAHSAYLMLNLSCPNTSDGRAFISDARRVRLLLEAVRDAAPSKPVFLKVAPFANTRSLEAFLEQVDASRLIRGFGINLAPGTPGLLNLRTPRLSAAPGAVAGAPCRDLMDRAAAEVYRRMDRKRYALIATGGVFSAADAFRKIRQGASLVQFLTALVFEGPAIVRRMVTALDVLLARDGFASVSDAVGVDALCRRHGHPEGLYECEKI